MKCVGVCRRKGASESGFTLVELMIAIAIIGTIATIAIPGFAGYKEQAQASELTMHLEAMFKGAAAYYSTEHVTGASTSAQTLNYCRVRVCKGQPTAPADGKTVYDFSQNDGCQAIGFGTDGPLRAFYVGGTPQGDPPPLCGRLDTDDIAYQFFAVHDYDADGLYGLRYIQARARGDVLYRTRYQAFGGEESFDFDLDDFENVGEW